MVQENKTTDFYFGAAMGPWGADVKVSGTPLTAAPDHDQPHDRNAWVHYRMGTYPAVDVQVETDVVIPFYSYLAKSFTFCDHHFGLGSNSTPGHLMLIGGQTPTLRNPSWHGPTVHWPLPTIFTHAGAAGITWAAFPSDNNYPVEYYTDLASNTANIHPPGDFATMCAAGTLPTLCYLWSPGGLDEHPPLHLDPKYVTRSEDDVHARVDAIVDAGLWDDTVFILTWDDWGGYTDHILTPQIEVVPDAIHPGGFAVIGGSRIPLLMFGGAVQQGIESEWHSHATVVKTVIDLLGLPAFGVDRVDTAPTLANRVSTSGRPAPPKLGEPITQPPEPNPPIQPTPPTPYAGLPILMPNLVTTDGSHVPAPTDGTVRRTPPALPTEATPVS
jgi:hypothetical protein